MFVKFNDILERERSKSEESGSALIFAILLTLVVMSLATIVTALGLVNIQKTVFTARYTYYALAAETAVSQALLVSNSTNGTQQLLNHQGQANAVTGNLQNSYDQLQGIKWQWYTQRVSGSSATSKYYIIATGYSTSPTEAAARTIRVTITSVANMRATYTTTNGIVYYPRPNAVSQWGIIGSSQIFLNTGAKVSSYISDTNFNPTVTTNQAQIASNGKVNIVANTGVNKVNLLNYSSAAPNRCVGTACSTYNQQQISYSTNLQEMASAVATACPLQTYPVWIASENSGLLAPGCYNSLIFDVDTSIASTYSGTNPANVYIKGDMIVNAGVTVNNAKSPQALRIYSQGGTNAKFNQGVSSSDPTKFYGVVAGSALTCTDGTVPATSVGGTATLYIYGSLACDVVNIGGKTQVWWDELSTELSGNTTNVRRLWYTEAYEELY